MQCLQHSVTLVHYLVLKKAVEYAAQLTIKVTQWYEYGDEVMESFPNQNMVNTNAVMCFFHDEIIILSKADQHPL